MSAEILVILPRLVAAFNRSTLLIDSDQPDGENPSDYYGNATTNHYARIVHATVLDHRGYTFPTMTSPRPAAPINRAPSPAGARACRPSPSAQYTDQDVRSAW